MWRNGLALGLVVGTTFTILLLTFLSSMATNGSNSTTEWITSVAAIISGTIGLFAVFLVNTTLKATEETLEATRMLGLNQSRAWVLVSSVKVQPDQDGTSLITVAFKNYGPSPATNLRTEIYVHNDSYPFAARPLQRPTNDYSIRDLPPDGIMERCMEKWSFSNKEGIRTRIRISLSYKLLDGSEATHFDEWVVFPDAVTPYARKVFPLDFANCPPDHASGIQGWPQTKNR